MNDDISRIQKIKDNLDEMESLLTGDDKEKANDLIAKTAKRSREMVGRASEAAHSMIDRAEEGAGKLAIGIRKARSRFDEMDKEKKRKIRQGAGTALAVILAIVIGKKLQRLFSERR